jgi:hypothetical protein
LRFLALLCLAVAGRRQKENAVSRIEQVIADGPFRASWESLETYTVPEWYQDAKFGIFIHWGVYAVPAFGSERFDPGQWAGLFRSVGARFVVPVTEHHDGFAMYDCGLSDWCAAKMGPRRDLIGDLAAAVRAQGLVFGLSSHRAEHWWFFDGGTQFDSDVTDPRSAGLYGPPRPENTQPDAQFLDDWLARTCELVDRYQPQLVWFDWWIEQPAFRPYLQQFAAYYYNRGAQWQRGVAINYKHQAFPERAAVFDVERGQLGGIRPLFWQADTSISKNSSSLDARHDLSCAVSAGERCHRSAVGHGATVPVPARDGGKRGSKSLRHALCDRQMRENLVSAPAPGGIPLAVSVNGPTIKHGGCERTRIRANSVSPKLPGLTYPAASGTSGSTLGQSLFQEVQSADDGRMDRPVRWSQHPRGVSHASGVAGRMRRRFVERQSVDRRDLARHEKGRKKP